jgi:hypothetical protein
LAHLTAFSVRHDGAGHASSRPAWESRPERLVAVTARRLAAAIALDPDDPRRDQLMDAVLGELPDELIADAAPQAGFILAYARGPANPKARNRWTV